MNYDSKRIWEMAFCACIIGKSQYQNIPGPVALAEYAGKTADAALTEYEKRYPPGKE